MASLGHNPEVLGQTLADRATLNRCPFCERDQWIAAEPIFVDVDPKVGPFIAGDGLPVLPLVCENCGFVRMHSTTILHRHASGR